MRDQTVIAAIASPAGSCARIVLRISGRGSHAVVCRLLAEAGELQSAGAIRKRLSVRGMTFPALLLLFNEGKSYTGEESAELHLPGNVILARLTLESLYDAGARPAHPGEFTARGFFNGRMNLIEAEGVACTIAATNERELNAARRLQDGELTSRLLPFIDELTRLLALTEAGIDFSDQDIRFLSAADVRDGAARACDQLQRLLRQSTRFERLSHEPMIVLCGRPNAGKSTLLNALAGRERAVVSPMAGTTRDLLSAEVILARGTVRVVDTAGLEGEQENADSRSEAEIPMSRDRKQEAEMEIAAAMGERARHAIASADVLVLVREAGDAMLDPHLSRRPDLIIQTKADLALAPYVASSLRPSVAYAQSVSVLTGTGMIDLRSALDDLAFGSRGGEELALNARHVRQIELAIAELTILADGPPAADELIAEHLRFCVDAIGEITGIVSTEDLLGRIFSTFCIGK